jgi:galactokinase
VTADPLHARFLAEFGGSPMYSARAPGRVNLIGEHTDYNGGFALPIAIDRDVQMLARVTGSNDIDVVSLNYDARLGWSIDAESLPFEPGSWPSYLAAVVQQFRTRGHVLPGLQIAVSGNIPQGAGLSSSAAYEVCAAALLNKIAGAGMTPQELALLGQAAENSPLVGVQCGIMDQYASACAQEHCAVLLDCHDLGHRQIPVPVEWAVVIINSMKQRALVGSEYNARRRECQEGLARLREAAGIAFPSLRHVPREALARHEQFLTPVQRKRVRHAIDESARVLEFAAALQARDAARAGQLLYQSHASLRDDYEVSCRELDEIVRIARGITGVHGCRMTGGGFGGCAVATMEPGCTGDFVQQLGDEYRIATDLTAEFYRVTPAGGASCRTLAGIGAE